MKYLKLYEEYSEDNLYTSIDQDEFDNYCGTIIKWNNHDIEKLKSVVSNSIYRKLRLSKRGKAFDINEFPDSCSIYSIGIYQIPDEYFLCEFSSISEYLSHYRCDSIDGLINLLSEYI